MSILILTGPPASGKNTVGLALAELRTKCALVDVDRLRTMVRKPHAAPWQGEEGLDQAKLGIVNAAMLSRRFLAYGCDVIILDFLWSYSLSLYRDELGGSEPKVVRLMPSLATCLKRNQKRGQWLQDDEVVMLYRAMEEFAEADLTIENDALAAGDVAVKLSEYMDSI